MRVLFTALAAAGHCYPLFPTAWAFRNAGHDVRFACAPGFAPVIAGAGLVTVPAGPDPDFASYWRGADAAPDPAADIDWRAHHAERARRSAAMFAGTSGTMVEPLLEHCRGWRPDLVVFEPRCYAGPVLAGLLGIPSARHCWGPDSGYLRVPNAVEPLEELCNRFGISWFAEKGRTPLTGTHTVEPAPPSLSVDSLPDSRNIRYVPFNGSAVLEREPPASRAPKVVVAWSATFARAGGHVAPVRAVLDALSGEPVEQIVLLDEKSRGLLGEGPANAEFRTGVPLENLLPSCDVVVHAGHGGTMMAAVAAGLPQLAVPGMADAFVNGKLISDAKIGLSVDYQLLEPDLVREHVRTLLGDVHREAARAVKAENDAQPGPAEVVESLLQ